MSERGELGPRHSYDMDALDEAAELERLRAQADLVRAMERAYLTSLELSPTASVLDLGCGPGFVSEVLGELVPGGRVWGADVDPALLALARQAFARRGWAHGEFVEAWADRLPLADASLDLVYARFLFQHLADPAAVLREVRRVLRPGGRVVLVDTDDAGLAVYPEPDGFQALLAASRAAQSRVGGDRYVGRKLRHHLVAGGFVEAQVRVEPFTSELVGMRAFLDIAVGYKRQIITDDLLPAAAVRDTMAALAALTGLPGAFGQTFGYVATARAPGA